MNKMKIITIITIATTAITLIGLVLCFTDLDYVAYFVFKKGYILSLMMLGLFLAVRGLYLLGGISFFLGIVTVIQLRRELWYSLLFCQYICRYSKQ